MSAGCVGVADQFAEPWAATLVGGTIALRSTAPLTLSQVTFRVTTTCAPETFVIWPDALFVAHVDAKALTDSESERVLWVPGSEQPNRSVPASATKRTPRRKRRRSEIAIFAPGPTRRSWSSARTASPSPSLRERVHRCGEDERDPRAHL